MRLGIMLRTIDEDQGIGIYTRNLIPRMLEYGPRNEYVLLYKTGRFFGQFSERANVREVLVKAPGKALWDQVAVPRAMLRHGADLIFHPKFTVPLLTRRPTVMVLHGPDQFRNPGHYSSLDVAYLRLMMPLYCRKAHHLISNSQFTKEEFIRLFNVPSEKVSVIHFAAADHFHPVGNGNDLEQARRRHRLPPRFMLSVTKYFRGKNVPALIRAFARLSAEVRIPLVLVGQDVHRYLDDLGLRGTALEREIHCLGWVDQKDLPAIYTLAELLAFPSLEESFGIPLVEAMRCGCPVVASNVGAIPEVTGDAAVLVRPTDDQELSAAMERVLTEPGLREELRQKGFERAARFTWNEHVRRTLEVLERLAGSAGTP